MFSRIFQKKQEPFVNSTDKASIGPETVKQYFGETLPNIIYGSDTKLNIEKITDTTNARMLNNDTTLKNPWANTGISANTFNERQSECEAIGNGDQFDHLVSLAGSQDSQSRLRCGWVYNTNNPQNGRGAYGTRDGPLKTSAQGTWMWNLHAAQEKYHKSICDQVTSCKDLDSSIFKGRCAWCSTSGKAVPILAGKVAYPYNANLNCSASAISKSSGECPQPKPVSLLQSSDPNYVRSPAQICDPLTNGSLARDCLVQKVITAGCNDTGTLAQALKSGSDSNYTDILTKSPAFVAYQQRAVIGLDETALRNGKFTVSQAIDEFKRVNEQASSSLNGGLQYAARDLCYNKGEFDKYDFCTEISDTKTGPFSPECLQKEFARAGGQKTGTLYPTMKTMPYWNSLNRWMDVKVAIKTLAANVNSSDRVKQEDAVNQFYGIKLQNKRKALLGSVPGIEIFWFTHEFDITKPTTFLGRRIRTTLPTVNQSSDIKGKMGKANNTDMTSFVYFANLNTSNDKSVRVRVTSDDGFATELNGNMSNYRNNMNVNSSNQLTNTGYFPPTTFTANSLWKLNANGVNVLSGYWFNGMGGLYYKVEMRDETNGFPSVPNFCGSLGRDGGGIRLYNKQECDGLNGNFYGNGECTKRQGGSYSWDCRELNRAPVWGEIPTSMINLTQEPFAPMLSFEVENSPGDFGCDYPFCDRRMGGFKMKWSNYNNGPSVKYAGDSFDTVTFPFGKNYLQFPGLPAMAGIRSVFNYRLYSFMTMTMLVTLRSVPAPGVSATPFISWGDSGYFPGIKLTGRPDGKSANINVFSAGIPYGVSPSMIPSPTTDGPVIEKDIPYLIVFRILRSNETDISTLNGLQIGAAKLTDLQVNPGALKESSIMSYSKPIENPDRNDQSFFLLNPDTALDLFWVHLFDYKLTGENLKHEANNDWLYLEPRS